MTVTAQTLNNPFSGPYSTNGSTTAFPFLFKAVSTVSVIVISVTGGVSTTVDPALYTVALNAPGGVPGEGGTVTFLLAPANGSSLYIYPSPSFAQDVNFVEGGPIRAKTLNSALDLTTLRSLVLKAALLTNAMLSPFYRAGKVLGWDASGNPQALALSNFKGDPGGYAGDIGLFSQAPLLNIAAGINIIATSGYSTLGVGSAVYIYDATVDAAYVTANPRSSFISANSRGFRLDREQDFSPEMFGSPANGVGDDGPGMAALSAFINTNGGGVISLSPVLYRVGSTTLHNPSVDQTGSGTGSYRFYPNTPRPIYINGCTKPVVVRLNGATVRSLAGVKYGTFNLDGTAMGSALGYSGDGIGIPYFAMIHVKDCTGLVHIQGPGDLDGNIQNALIGGYWGPGFDGRQIAMSGIILENSPNVVIDGGEIKSHHHGLDGMIGNGPGLLNTREKVVINDLTCTSNGRQGLSMVGGNGWVFRRYKGEKTGRDIGGMVYSSPGAGCDLEAEGGKYVVGTKFHDSDFVDNAGAGMIADSSANTFDADFYGCRFIGTTVYSLWANRPGIRLHDCVCAGEIVHLFADPDLTKAFRAYRTKFTMDTGYSLTGALYGGLMDLSSSDVTNVTFTECEFEKIGNGAISAGAVPGSPPVGPYLDNCSAHAPNSALGTFNLYGFYRGPKTALVNVQTFPGAPADATVWGGTINLGLAEDSFTWSYPLTLAGLSPPATVATRYRPNFDRATQKKLYYGSATYNPPSLAAGAKDTIQTITVTGVAVGDFVVAQSFSIDLAGARIPAWVSAANTVSFYAVNDNGTNPLDLASATFKVTVRQA